MRKKLFRITTVPMSLKLLLTGQLKYMSDHFEVTAVSSAGSDLDIVHKNEGVRTISLEMSRRITPLKDLFSIIKMVRLFRKEKPFIVHSHTPKAGLVAMAAARLTGVPHRLHTVAGMPLMESSGIKRIILAVVEKFTYSCSTQIYCNSFGLMKHIAGYGLINPDRVKVLGNGSTNGIDTTYFDRTPEVVRQAEEFKSKNGITADYTVFCFAGRIVKDKGMNELLTSFDEISRDNKSVKLILIGWFEPELDPLSESAMQILEENKNIIRTGYQDDIRPFLTASSVFVFPSYREGFPNVVMQAGSLGLPCIVSDINGCNEIIMNNTNGMIVKPKDKNALKSAMLDLISDKDRIRSLSSGARSVIKAKYERNFVWSELLKEYKGLE